MRKIEYIFIDSDCENHDGKSGGHVVPNFGYHYVVNQWSSEHNASSLEHCRVATEVGTANSQGCVINPTDVSITNHIIQGPVYDPDKYNKCSIFIRYCGSIRSEAWLINPDASVNAVMAQRAALLQLLVHLRKHFPDAKILGVSEIDGRELYCMNIIVSDAMNVLRLELSDYP